MVASTQKLIRISAFVALLTGMAIPRSAVAQDVAVGQAEAVVLTVVSVTSSASLDFGDVLQGVPTSIANNNASAAIFEIAGETDAGVDLYLLLPQQMHLADNSDRMPIIFSSTDASIDTTGAGDPPGMAGGKGWQNVNPNSLPTAVTIGSAGTDLYLGGTTVPSPNQKAGAYAADVVLTVSYNGQ